MVLVRYTMYTQQERQVYPHPGSSGYHPHPQHGWPTLIPPPAVLHNRQGVHPILCQHNRLPVWAISHSRWWECHSLTHLHHSFLQQQLLHQQQLPWPKLQQHGSVNHHPHLHQQTRSMQHPASSQTQHHLFKQTHPPHGTHKYCGGMRLWKVPPRQPVSSPPLSSLPLPYPRPYFIQEWCSHSVGCRRQQVGRTPRNQSVKWIEQGPISPTIRINLSSLSDPAGWNSSFQMSLLSLLPPHTHHNCTK